MKRFTATTLGLKILFWLMLIGMVVNAGTLMISFVVSLVINPLGAENLYMGFDLSDVMEFSAGHYMLLVFLMIAMALIKANIAWRALRILKRLNPERPFDPEIAKRIIVLGRVAMIAALAGIAASVYTRWLDDRVAFVPWSWGGGELLLLAGVVYLIGGIYQRGVGLQNENDLTV